MSLLIKNVLFIIGHKKSYEFWNGDTDSTVCISEVVKWFMLLELYASRL